MFFFTPILVYFLVFYIGSSIYHPNPKRKKILENMGMDEKEIRGLLSGIFSISFGILMFPNILTFLPFMIILFLPSIFCPSYYKKLFLLYLTIICPGTATL